jgi:predicted nucleic acid-binding protein
VVKTLFDTSVLVASFWVDHPKHRGSIFWLEQVKSGKIEGVISSHTLAEIYAVLTSLPVRPRISPTLAQQMSQENLARFEVISLTPEDYQMVVTQMVNLNLTGGAIYDALIAQAALIAKVAQLLTLNPNHFTRLGEEIARLVKVPE